MPAGKFDVYRRQVKVKKIRLLSQFIRLSQQTKAQSLSTSLSTAKDHGPWATGRGYWSTLPFQNDFIENRAARCGRKWILVEGLIEVAHGGISNIRYFKFILLTHLLLDRQLVPQQRPFLITTFYCSLLRNLGKAISGL